MSPTEQKGEGDVHVGGQAVIEGVMMRGSSSVAVAVRKPDDQISLKVEAKPRWTTYNPIYSLPFIRGVVTLAETLTLGMNTLMYSAEQAGAEEEKLSKAELSLSLTISILVTIALFIAGPAFVFSRLKALPINLIVLNLIEGSIRIAIFVAFLSIINLMPDMRRVFEYHGAEHKSINAYESFKEKPGFSPDKLTPASVKPFSALHPACGTSFLITVLIVSIIVFSFLGRPSFLLRVALKLLLLPVVAGISYEIIRLSRAENAPAILKALSAPGLWLQRLTTKEPDDSEIEVAIAALKAVI